MDLYIDINSPAAVPTAKPHRVALLSQPSAIVGSVNWSNQELADLAGILVVTGFDPQLQTATGGATDNQDGTATPNADDKTLETMQGECNALVVSKLETYMAGLVSASYGPHERETWRKQEDEARAYTGDNQASTSYLDSIRITGETRADQVTAIMAKVAAVETATGAYLKRKRELLASLYLCADASEIRTWLDNELTTGWTS